MINCNILELEKEASQKSVSRAHLSDPEWHFCVYMLEKYGDDYKVSCEN